LLQTDARSEGFLSSPSWKVSARSFESKPAGHLKGQKISHYEMLSLVGAGGMGEVYKARDTRLDRTVAIKVLPDHVVADSERKMRFEREARAVSQLNHPHVCTLYDVGQHNGLDYLVMEYLEGETLAQRLERGPLGRDEALKVAVELGGALDKAHRQGVTHRDLKPGNVMLTRHGAKLLDFGLAKLKAPSITSESAPPTAPDATGPGMILGTLQYMAPEQLEGKEADARSDIFAFGALLYEMLSGKKAFEGETQPKLITAIVSSHPAPLSKLDSATPPALDHLLSRCLAKDPDDRWQTTHDLVAELRWIAGGSERAGLEPAGTEHRGRDKWRWPMVAFAVLSVAALAAAFLSFQRPAIPEEMRIFLSVPWRGPVGGMFTLAPDGSQFVYIGSDGRLWVRDFGVLEPRALPGTEHADSPFFSPDGKFVGFGTGGALKIVAVAGGPVRTLVSGSPPPGIGDWASDDQIYFSQHFGLWKVASGGGTPEEVSRPTTAGVSYAFVDVLPSGKGAFLTIRNESVNTSAIGLLNLLTGDVQSLFPGAQARFVKTGHVLYATADGTLHRAPFDQKTLRLTGPATPVVENVDIALYASSARFSVSDNGRLLYQRTLPSQSEAVMVTKDGVATPLTPDPWIGDFYSLSLSPDGKRIAASLTYGLRQDVWTRSLETGAMNKLTHETDGTLNYRANWTGDGQSLTYISNRSGTSAGELWRQRADGSSRAERLVADGPIIDEGLLSPDSQWAVYRVGGSGLASRDIKAVQLGNSDNGTPKVIVGTSSEEYGPVLSTDGKWLAYVSDTSGREEVYVRPFPGTDTAVWQISRGGGSEPVWARNGRQLFYRSAKGTLMAVAIRKATSTFEWDPPQALFDVTGYLFNGWHSVYDAAPDGERFLMARRIGATQVELVLILNWSPDADAKLRGGR
jgi:serine/threonine-protein kinase